MADRGVPPPNTRLGTTRITRAATSATGIRRNLFQHQPNRRPTPTEMSRPGATVGNSHTNTNSHIGGGNGGGNAGVAANNNHQQHHQYHHNQPLPLTASSSTNSAETLRLDLDVLSETSDIVIRDQNGEFEIEDPPTPPLDDPDDEAALDDAQENERTCAVYLPTHILTYLHIQSSHQQGTGFTRKIMCLWSNVLVYRRKTETGRSCSTSPDQPHAHASAT